MAFGGLRGTLVVNATSITNPTVAAGSVAVQVGDLVVAMLVQQTALTVTGCTSSFVTTYTPLHAGTIAGAAVSARVFYGRVTSAGTLTAVNFACTASANNVAAMAAVIEGPFDASPLDINQANITSDAASPFTCPATGTLSQANEFVIAWGAANYGTVWTSTSPNIELVEQATAALAKGCIGGQVVSSTASVTPVFAAASNPTQAILGTASFKQDLTAPRKVYEWPLTLGQTPEVGLRTYLSGWNPNLLIQPEPPGVTYILRAPTYTNPREPLFYTSLRSWFQGPKPQEPPPPIVQYVYRDPFYVLPRGPEYHVQLRSWFGRLPPPVVVVVNPFAEYDWPNPKGFTYPVDIRTITASFNPNLRGQDLFPPGIEITDLVPRAPDHHVLLRSWTWSYNRNLIGKDALPPGKDVLDLTPRPYDHHVQLRTWTWNYNPNLVGEDKLPTGEIRTELARGYEHHVQLRSWTWNYNQNLIGQDQFPPGDEFTDLPAQPSYPIQLRNWFGAIPPVVAVVEQPVTKTDWPNPKGYIYPLDLATLTESFNLNLIGQDKLPAGEIRTELARGPEHHVQLRTWTWGYNLNLIGKDELPVGEIITELAPRPPLSANQLRTWINFASLALATPPAPKPFAQLDWPLNFGPKWPIHIFTATFNKNLIGQDKLPAGDIVTDLPPRAPQQPTPIFTASYNKNLIGKDQLPVGAESIALPPQPALSAIQLRTWISNVSLALIAGPQVRPFFQTDWPINTGPRQPTQIFTSTFLKTLIGKDRLPAGEIITALPEQQRRAAITWIQTVNLALSVRKPFNQTDWPLPAPATQPNRSFAASYNKNLVGQDKLPTGDNLTGLPPQPGLSAQQLRTWINTVNLALNTPLPPKPFAQYNWPLFVSRPDARIDGWQQRSLALSTFIPQPLPKNQYYWPLPSDLIAHGIENKSWDLSTPITLLPPIPVPDPTKTFFGRRRLGPGHEWQPWDRANEPRGYPF